MDEDPSLNSKNQTAYNQEMGDILRAMDEIRPLYEKYFTGSNFEELAREVLQSRDLWVVRIFMARLKFEYLAMLVAPSKLRWAGNPRVLPAAIENQKNKLRALSQQILPQLAWLISGKTRAEWEDSRHDSVARNALFRTNVNNAKTKVEDLMKIYWDMEGISEVREIARLLQ